jgi:hypothetical protein
MDILQPAPGAARMGHLLRAVKITEFVIKWGAHLSTLAARQRSRQALTRTAEVARQQWGQTSMAWRSSTGRLFRGRRTRRMDILQPAPGAAMMGHLLRGNKITGFVIRWGAHLSTLAAGVWMLNGMVIIKVQANKEQRLLENQLVKGEGREGKKYEDDARLMDIYSFPGYQVEIEVPTNPDGLLKPVILDETLRVRWIQWSWGRPASQSMRSRRRRRSSRRRTGST